MGSDASVMLVLLAAVVFANLPFVNDRFGVIGPMAAKGKSLAVRGLEVLIGSGLAIALGTLLEVNQGQAWSQGWEFFVAMACFSFTLAFPGFVWRVLRRHH